LRRESGAAPAAELERRHVLAAATIETQTV